MQTARDARNFADLTPVFIRRTAGKAAAGRTSAIFAPL